VSLHSIGYIPMKLQVYMCIVSHREIRKPGHSILDTVKIRKYKYRAWKAYLVQLYIKHCKRGYIF